MQKLVQVVDIDTETRVLERVGERVAELERRVRAGLLHVVAADRDAVELWHVLRATSGDRGSILYMLRLPVYCCVRGSAENKCNEYLSE